MFPKIIKDYLEKKHIEYDNAMTRRKNRLYHFLIIGAPYQIVVREMHLVSESFYEYSFKKLFRW